ncbi:MAG: hypothetical protein HY259_06720 [Chloroflexi bacterium]|nr:hypothetical protein [Chloroflexota bacterium]MBI3733136.1 hypothetical protein [Chloroflexota bacterium]
MIRYFVSAGDPEVGDMFDPYIWAPWGLGKRLKVIRHKNYGIGLTLLLIQYYVEGRFPTFGPEQLKVRNYSTKNKDIAVAIPVTRHEFHQVGDIPRKQFIVRSTLEAIDAVQARLAKRKLDIDFESLRQDVEKISEEYLAG